MNSESNNGHRIFLIGMPGCGKSYWGQLLANDMDREFIDLDAYVAMREGVAVQDLITGGGEELFREKENRYLAEIIGDTGKKVVVACGGGTPCFSDNIRLMKMNGIVIYLESDIARLVHNLQGDDTVRPLLAGADSLAQQLQTTYMIRKQYYEQAHFILPAADISLANFAQILGHE